MKSKNKQTNKQTKIYLIVDVTKLWHQQEIANNFTFNLWSSPSTKRNHYFFFLALSQWMYYAYFKVDLLIQVFIQFHYKGLSNMVSLNICKPVELNNEFHEEKCHRLNNEKANMFFLKNCGKIHATWDLPSSQTSKCTIQCGTADLKRFSSCITEILYPLNSNSPYPSPLIPWQPSSYFLFLWV